METFEFAPKGVCSKKMVLHIEENKLQKLEVLGGCSGNLQGISSLVAGMDIDEVATRLQGIQCGMRPTSCPDQLTKGIQAYIAQKQSVKA